MKNKGTRRGSFLGKDAKTLWHVPKSPHHLHHPLPSTYSHLHMERRDSSPREKMREGRGMGCVSILVPSTSIYSAKTSPYAALGRHQCTNEVVTRGVEEWGPSWWIFHEKELRDFGRIFGQAPGTAFGSSRQADTWKASVRGLKVGSADPGVAPIASVFVQVTARWVPRWVWGCSRCF
jgi:hypothetical protein